MKIKYIIIYYLLIFVFFNCSIVVNSDSKNNENPYSAYDFHYSFENDSLIDSLITDGDIYSSSQIEKSREKSNYGSQSIKLSGEIGADQYDSLNVTLILNNIVSDNATDFSLMNMEFSIFISTDTPIDYANIVLYNGTDSVIVGGNNIIPGQWNDVKVNIQMIFHLNAWEYKGALSDTEARFIIKNTDRIMLKAQRNTAGIADNTFCYIDDIRWKLEEVDIMNVPTDNGIDSLRKYADIKNMKFGAATGPYLLFEPQYAYTLTQEYNCIVADGDMKWNKTEPQENVFNTVQVDLLVEYAQNNNKYIRGHTLAWHSALPEWIESKDYSELQSILENHIEVVMGRYAGKIYAWDVFNEVVRNDGSGFRNNNESAENYSIWSDDLTDDTLIKAAFIKANQVDPSCKLFLNEYSNEEIGDPKADKFYEVVNGLINDGIPIHGVGFQLHLREESPIDMTKFRQNIDRFTALGMEIHFTEIDVRIRVSDLDLNTPAGQAELQTRLENQAEIYEDLMQIVLDYDEVTSVLTWGFTDKYSWIPDFLPDFDYALIFDEDYEKKPAYDRLLDLLKL